MLRSWSGLLLIAVVVKEAGSKDLPLLSLGRYSEAELYCWPTTALYHSCRHRCHCPVSHLYPNSNLMSASGPNPDPHLLHCILAPAGMVPACARAAIAPHSLLTLLCREPGPYCSLDFFSSPPGWKAAQWKRAWGCWSTARGL